MLAESMRQTVKVNVSGRVFACCRRCGVREPHRIAHYTRAVECAVLSVLGSLDDPMGGLEPVLSGQLTLLEVALRAAVRGTGVARRVTPPEPDLATADDTRAAPPPESPDEAGASPRRPAEPPPPPPSARSMEQKLKEARKPLSKLLREDCVHLGLVTAERAEQLVAGLAGRTPEDAEAEVVAELRNNLHAQLRAYMRKHKGGPWPTPKVQEELRLDIVATRSVANLLTLARQLLREREQWESTQGMGRVRSLLAGKVLLGLRRRF